MFLATSKLAIYKGWHFQKSARCEVAYKRRPNTPYTKVYHCDHVSTNVECECLYFTQYVYVCGYQTNNKPFKTAKF